MRVCVCVCVGRERERGKVLCTGKCYAREVVFDIMAFMEMLQFVAHEGGFRQMTPPSLPPSNRPRPSGMNPRIGSLT